MRKRQEQQADFDAYAGEYGALLRDPIRERFATTDRFFFQRKLQIIRSFYKRRGVDTRTLSWLDVGCGQGDLLRLGRPCFASVHGCDPSSEMLQSCPDLEVKQQPSLDRLPFGDKSFDFITAVCVYHHVPDQRRPPLTMDVLRLLKPGGIVCVIEHNPLNPVTRLIVSRTPVDADAQLLTARQTRQLLASAGTSILETRYFLLFPERLHKLFASIERGLEAVPLGGQYCVFAQGR